MEYLISILALIFSFAVKLVGAPSQIKKLIHLKDSSSISIVYTTIVFLSYITWAIHAVLKNDNFLAFAQIVGVISSGTVLFFVVKYRKKT